MRSVLVAGASGTLGRLTVRLLRENGYRVRALSRRPLSMPEVETVTGDMTNAQSLVGCCDGIDVVISCAGASMNIRNVFDRSTFTRVDFHGNVNLLAEAQRSSVQKFIYVSVADAVKFPQLEYCRAHLLFERTLTTSGIGYAIVQPTGFYYVIGEIAAMAKKGRGIVFGDGSSVSNPVHEEDVANEAVRSIDGSDRIVAIGGPEIFSRKKIVELAFAATGRKESITSISPKLFAAMIAPMRIVNPRIHALLAFGAAVSTTDAIAPAKGRKTLEEYFRLMR